MKAMRSMKVKSMFGSLKRRRSSEWACRKAVSGVLADILQVGMNQATMLVRRHISTLRKQMPLVVSYGVLFTKHGVGTDGLTAIILRIRRC